MACFSGENLFINGVILWGKFYVIKGVMGKCYVINDVILRGKFYVIKDVILRGIFFFDIQSVF